MEVKEHHEPDAPDYDNVCRMLWWSDWWAWAAWLRTSYYKTERKARHRNKPECLTYNG